MDCGQRDARDHSNRGSLGDSGHAKEDAPQYGKHEESRGQDGCEKKKELASQRHLPLLTGHGRSILGPNKTPYRDIAHVEQR